nr:polysaccharide deacetylase family protein [uncultured Desulfuromonas sp.]
MIKKILVCVLLAVLLLPWAGWATDNATVFVYHRFGDARYPSTNIALDVFEAQLAYLKQHNYQVVTLGQIAAAHRMGTSLPQHCVALTVDDAYESFLTGAMPLLRRYHYPATLFVSTDSVAGESYLDWDQLKGLQQEGIEIGNHSASHPYFVSEQVNRTHEDWQLWAQQEINQAQQQFRMHLGFSPELFAYPYGEYSPELKAVVEQMGFKAAAAQQSGVISASAELFALPRFPMGGPFATLKGFREKLSMDAMPVTVLDPPTPLITSMDPPRLRFQLDPQRIVVSSLRCYVQGQNSVVPQLIDREKGLFEVVAEQPLAGRRNKYTLTAQSRKGGKWLWFSQLWIHP